MELTKEKKLELQGDFIKYEKYIYSILGTGEYHSKVNKAKNKVNIYDVKMLGMDFEDLVQQGRLFLWEALLRYGFFPEKSKTEGPRKAASKSTFVYKHITNMFINLGIKASSRKFKRTDVCIDDVYNLYEDVTVEDTIIFEEDYKDKLRKEIESNKKFLEKNKK